MAEPTGAGPTWAEPAERPAWTARKLLRAARVGTLATSADGQPFASLVTPAPAPDLALLLLLSDLSEHTRHLRAEPRCALMVAAGPADANPQTAPRVTVTGLAERVEDAALKARWLAVHPYAAFYAGFADFHLWRIAPRGALFVGGFGRAARLRAADLAPDPGAAAAIAAAEAALIASANAEDAAGLAAIGAAASGIEGAWRLVALDADGADLALDDRAQRIAWAAPVSDPGAVRAELARLARAARGAPGPL